MRVASGTVVSGRVVIDDAEFIDGTEVVVISREQEAAVHLSPDELAELEAGIAEADRGETISGDELFARLGRHG
jgi:predicted transcriptional regulator